MRRDQKGNEVAIFPDVTVFEPGKHGGEFMPEPGAANDLSARFREVVVEAARSW